MMNYEYLSTKTAEALPWFWEVRAASPHPMESHRRLSLTLWRDGLGWHMTTELFLSNLVELVHLGMFRTQQGYS